MATGAAWHITPVVSEFSVPGLRLGHCSLGDTGVTAIVSTDTAGALGAVDVRGGGPGTRETDSVSYTHL